VNFKCNYQIRRQNMARQSVVGWVMGLLLVSGAGADDVGIIEGTTGCPSEATERVFLDMDAEDRTEGSYTEGWVGATAIDQHANVTYYFCRVPGETFAGARGRFAVLSLGDSCPQGAFQYKRHFDNEDSRTSNHSGGNIYPSWVQSSGNSLMVFCLFNNTGSNPLPDFSTEYGVFSSVSGVASGFIFSDDENNRNINYYEANGIRTRSAGYPDIIRGVSDTMFSVLRIP
jgi:hypothetical protein